MDYKKIIIHQIRKSDTEADHRKLNMMTKQELENDLRKKKNEAPREKILVYLGLDSKNRPVFRDEIGSYWKKKTADSKELYSSFTFHGEPFALMREDIVCRYYNKERRYECREN